MAQRSEREDSPDIEAASHYTQINFLFKPGAIELPSADSFKAFPEEAQKAIIDAFRSEQDHRREWIKTQQSNDHELNLLRQRHAFRIRFASLLAGFILVIAALGAGVWLIHTGATPYGVGVILAGLATLIGTAIYGHKAKTAPSRGAKEPAEPREQISPAKHERKRRLTS